MKLPLRHTFEALKDGFRAREQLPVERVEPAVGGKEDKSARYSNCNSDHLPIELNGEALLCHRKNTSPSGRRAHHLATVARPRIDLVNRSARRVPSRLKEGRRRSLSSGGLELILALELESSTELLIKVI